jgi:hypothetical protein
MPETLAGITAKTRSLLGDPDATMYPDTLLLGPVNIAGTIVGNELRVYGVDRMRNTTLLSNVPIGTLALSMTSSPALPASFLSPIQLWEKPAGSAATNYTPIMQAREQIPPGLIPGPLMGQYTFFNGVLNFIGATQALDILIDFIQSLSDLAAPSDAVPVADTTVAIANKAAAIIAEADQPESAGAFESDFQAELDRIVRIYNKNRQRRPRRPRRYRSARIGLLR